MKKRTFLSSCLLLLCLLTACGKEKLPDGHWIMAEESQRKFTDVLVIRIVEFDLEANRFTYQIQNPTQITYGYGAAADFALEVLHNGIWHKMQHEPGRAVTRELHILNPGESKEYSASLMGALPSGNYRLVKEVHKEDTLQKSEFICCEFIVE